MPQDNWRWLPNDEIIRTYLSAGEIAGVTRWQINRDYMFEFHDGHTTGRPIYIRPNDNTDDANLPKFDTRNTDASHFPNINSLRNGLKLRSQLNNAAQADLMAIIQNEWTALAQLAKRYWNKTPVLAVDDNAYESQLAAWASREMEDATHIECKSMDEIWNNARKRPE